MNINFIRCYITKLFYLRSFLINSSGFFTYTIMLSENRVKIFHFQLLHPPIISSCLIKIGRSFKTMLYQFSSVAQLCLTLCDPMNHSTPGLPVHYQLPEFTQIHVHRVSDAIQPSHPLASPSPPAPNPSQHQSLFQ